MLNLQQLCLLRISTGTTHYRVGTGYAVTPTLILTAFHVVVEQRPGWQGTSTTPVPSSVPSPTDSAVTVEVLFPARTQRWEHATLQWHSLTHDVCLLSLKHSPTHSLPASTSVCWGHYTRTLPILWHSAGFPLAGRNTADALRDIVSLSGTITPEGGLRRDHYELLVNAPPHMETWPGFSGSPVFAEGCLIGVISAIPSAFGGDRAHAVPLSALFSDPQWIDLMGTPTIQSVPREILRSFATSPVSLQHSNPGSLLRAYDRVIPFFPQIREQEWNDLSQWCWHTSDPSSIRLLIGSGGSGKTRLLLEWVESCKQHGWMAGFLPENLAEQDWEKLLFSGKETLIVIDYAETRPHLSQELIRLLDQTRLPKLRIALLARDLGDWWTQLPTYLEHLRYHLDEEVQGRLVRRLTPIPSLIENRQAIYQAAYQHFMKHLSLGTASSPDFASILPDLSDPHFDNILYIHAAALAHAQGIGFQVTTLFSQTLERELKCWRQLFFPTPPHDRQKRQFDKTASQLVAALTLRGGISSQAEALTLHQRIQGPDPSFFSVLEELYPAPHPDLYLRGLEPDLLGETLVFQVLQTHKTPESYLEQVFAEADATTLQHGFVVLGRISTHHPQETRIWIASLLQQAHPIRVFPAFEASLALGTQTAFSSLGQVLAEQLEQFGTTVMAETLASRIRKRSLSQHRLALWVTETLLEHMPQPQTPEQWAEQIQLLHEKIYLLDPLQRNEEALALAQQAVSLSQTHLANHASGLAMVAQSYQILSLRLNRQQQHHDALTAATESVNLYRNLVDSEPTTQAALATALHGLSVQQHCCHQPENALCTLQEAVSLRRLLAASCVMEHQAALATSLSQLALLLGKMKRHPEALEAAQQALELRQSLAQKLPDTYLPDLAQSYNNLSIRHSRLRQHQQALRVAEQAVQIMTDCAKLHETFDVQRLLGYTETLLHRLRENQQNPRHHPILQETISLLQRHYPSELHNHPQLRQFVPSPS